MKRYLDKNVYEAAVERYDYIYENFERVCVSFSNGKIAVFYSTLPLRPHAVTANFLCTHCTLTWKRSTATPSSSLTECSVVKR